MDTLNDTKYDVAVMMEVMDPGQSKRILQSYSTTFSITPQGRPQSDFNEASQNIALPITHVETLDFSLLRLNSETYFTFTYLDIANLTRFGMAAATNPTSIIYNVSIQGRARVDVAPIAVNSSPSCGPSLSLDLVYFSADVSDRFCFTLIPEQADATTIKLVGACQVAGQPDTTASPALIDLAFSSQNAYNSLLVQTHSTGVRLLTSILCNFVFSSILFD